MPKFKFSMPLDFALATDLPVPPLCIGIAHIFPLKPTSGPVYNTTTHRPILFFIAQIRGAVYASTLCLS